MVTNRKKHSEKTPVKQGPDDIAPEPNKINGSTPYDFNGKNLTPYGSLLPVITMLEKLGFQSLVEQTVTSKRIPRSMDLYRFVLGIVLRLYIGFPRLNQLRFVARDPILTGILRVTKLPVQSTFWRFVNALHRNIARQMLTIMADHAGTGLGGGQRAVGGRHHRHRYHRAHLIWTADGRAQGV